MTVAERKRLRAEIDRVQRGRLATLRGEPRFPWEGPSPSYEATRKREKLATTRPAPARGSALGF